MRAYILTIVLGSIVSLSLFSGCRTNPRTQRETALLRAEILDLEDQYYSMKSRYESTVRQLRECRGEPVDAPIDGLTGSEMMLNGPYGECLDCEPGVVIQDSETYLESPGTAPQSLDTFREAEPPASFDTDGASPSSRPLEELPPAENVPQSGSRDRLDLEWGDEAVNLQTTVHGVVINPRFTYASNVDGRQGDDGLVLLVQPQAENNRPVTVPGQLIVEIVDPAGSRDHRRIGRWEFTQEELRLFADQNHKGYTLHLPWDRTIPKSSRLRVLVRFITTAGKRLDSSSEFQLTPPSNDYSPNDPLIARWTLRAGGQANESNSGSVRRGVNAIPASSGTRIQRPTWRPVR